MPAKTREGTRRGSGSAIVFFASLLAGFAGYRLSAIDYREWLTVDLNAYIRLLQGLDANLRATNVALLTEATEDLRAYAQSIEHRQTGNMATSTHRLGPFPVGEGILEAKVISGADYAGLEVGRGGTHDWVSRTIAERDGRILQLQLEVEQALISALTGGAS